MLFVDVVDENNFDRFWSSVVKVPGVIEMMSDQVGIATKSGIYDWEMNIIKMRELLEDSEFFVRNGRLGVKYKKWVLLPAGSRNVWDFDYESLQAYFGDLRDKKLTRRFLKKLEYASTLNEEVDYDVDDV